VSEGIKEQLQAEIECITKLPLQTDELTEVAGLAKLLVFIRQFSEENIQEGFIFCLPLSGRSPSSDVVKAVNTSSATDDIS
jgi:hypothetical protein